MRIEVKGAFQSYALTRWKAFQPEQSGSILNRRPDNRQKVAPRSSWL
jgi:hypothetical protein